MDNRDPYAPPASAVADPSIDAGPAPRATRRGLRLLWLALGLGLISALPAIRGQAPLEDMPAGLYLGLVAFFCVVFAALTVLIARRHNWARWVMVVFLVLGWASLVTDFSTTYAASRIAALLDAGISAIEIAACYFLFTGPSNAWFRGERAAGNAV